MVGLSKKPKAPVTEYEYDVNGTFANGVSIIGGPVTISGYVVLMMCKDLQPDDETGIMGMDVNGVDVSTAYPYRDYEYDGLWSASFDAFGWVAKMYTGSVDVPHTSFDVKNRDGATRLFHRTVKVVVLNR